MAYQKVLGASDPPSSTSVEKVVKSDSFKTASTILAIFHGYRRNNSLLWALAWGAAARVAPVVTPTVAVAQGLGKRKTCP